MLFNRTNDLQEVLQRVQKELGRATVDRKHPFRYVVLSTVSESVSSRYVVLRKIDDSGALMIYTDIRSRKVTEVKDDQRIQLVFFHPKMKTQVIVSGNAEILSGSVVADIWSNIQGNAWKAYTSVDAPGTPVANPTDAYRWDKTLDSQYFAVLKIVPTSIEVLQLDRFEHLRMIFTAENNWEGNWLVP